MVSRTPTASAFLFDIGARFASRGACWWAVAAVWLQDAQEDGKAKADFGIARTGDLGAFGFECKPPFCLGSIKP